MKRLSVIFSLMIATSVVATAQDATHVPNFKFIRTENAE